MLKNYFRTALRNFWRNKTFSSINVFGLSVGLTASLVLFLIVYHEFSFDRFEKNAERIYRVVLNIEHDGQTNQNAAVPAPLAGAAAESLTGLELTVPLLQFQGDATANVIINQGQQDEKIFKNQEEVIFTNSDLFSLLSYKCLQGDASHALAEPFTVVLTESRAREYFPELDLSDIPGRRIAYNDSLVTTVTGIVKDLNKQTFFSQKEFISVATIAKTSLQREFMMDTWNDWMAYSQLFIKTAPGVSKAQMETNLEKLFAKHDKNRGKPGGMQLSFKLQPLSDVHFNLESFGHRTAHKPTLYGLLAVAGFLLLLGGINFINLTTANATQRAREIGVRKVMGSSKAQLITQFLSETFLITLIGAIIAVAATPLVLNLFSDLVPPGLKFNIFNQPEMAAFIFLLVIVVTLLAGSYPAWILSKFRPVSVLKGQVRNAKGDKAWLRKSLTISQFVIAQFLVIATWMVSKQINFTMTKDLGFRKEAIVTFNLPRRTSNTDRSALMQKINAIPEIQMASVGFLPPASDGPAYTNVTYTGGNEEFKIDVQIRWGDPNFLKLYQIKILAGRNVLPSDTIREFLINETYARAIGFNQPSEAIGRTLNFNDKKIPIVGVMQDFHERSLHAPVDPVVFGAFNNRSNTMHLALGEQQAGSGSWQAAISKAEQAFKSIYPGKDFNYSFLDEQIAMFYESEHHTAKLLSWATGMAIVISCLGLLGLVIYTTDTRQKEIGIRKILGATVTQLVSILSMDFIKLVFIAFVIAAPFAWLAVNKWLQDFVYRTEVSWWVFAGSAIALMLVALLTLSIQTIRAAIANPVKSLRNE